jgi:hypothetical protein
MLLFVRNPYYRDILSGAKRFEMRCGPRYRNLAIGTRLSLNGRERAIVTRIERFARPEEASRASSAAGYYLSVAAIASSGASSAAVTAAG